MMSKTKVKNSYSLAADATVLVDAAVEMEIEAETAVLLQQTHNHKTHKLNNILNKVNQTKLHNTETLTLHTAAAAIFLLVATAKTNQTKTLVKSYLVNF
jgi:D-Tyr-tRNAtyr deacylase